MRGWNHTAPKTAGRSHGAIQTRVSPVGESCLGWHMAHRAAGSLWAREKTTAFCVKISSYSLGTVSISDIHAHGCSP